MNAGSIADPYLTDRAYRKGDLVMNNGYLYSALTDMDAGEWDDTKWLRTNVAARVPTRTSELENDSGFLTSVGEWEDITSSITIDSRYFREGLQNTTLSVNRAIGLMLLQFSSVLNSFPAVSGDQNTWKKIASVQVQGIDASSIRAPITLITSSVWDVKQSHNLKIALADIDNQGLGIYVQKPEPSITTESSWFVSTGFIQCLLL